MAAKGKVTVEFTGDPAELVRKLTALEGKIKNLEDGLGRGGRSAKGFGSELGSMASGLLGIGTAAGTAAAAWKLVAAEIGQTINLQKEAARAQITVGAARANVIRNMPGRADAEIQRTLSAGTAIAGRTGVEEKFIQDALSQAISASGGNINASLKAVEQAAKMLADQPEAIARYAGSLLDLSKVTGTIDARVNQGLLNLVAGQSRVVDPKLQAANAPEGLIGQMPYGSTAQEAGALWAAISTAAADAMGATTSTTAIALAEQLGQFLPKEGRAAKVEGGLSEPEKIEMESIRARAEQAKKRHAEGLKLSEKERSIWSRYDSLLEQQAKTRTAPAVAAGLDTTGKRIEFLQRNPEMAKLFLESASFEKKQAGVVRELLTAPASTVAGLYRSNLAASKDAAGLGALADESIRQLGIDPFQNVARTQRAFTSGAERLLTSSPETAMGAVTREGVVNLLEKSGQGALATKIKRMLFEGQTGFGTQGALQAAIDMTEARAQELSTPKVNPSAITAGMSGIFRGGTAPAANAPATIAPTAIEIEQAKVLREVVKELQAIRVETAKTAQGVAKTADNTGKSTAGPTLAKPEQDR